MVSRRARGALAAAALAALWLSACGGGGDDKAADRPAPSAPAERPAAGPGNGRGGVRLQKLGEFASPVYVAQPPGDDGDLYVIEQEGRIQVLHDGRVEPQPFLDISADVLSGGEQGLLSVAFAPDYTKSGRFYVDFTSREGDGDTRIVEYRRSEGSPLRADPASRRDVLRIDQPYPNHNGGLVAFGPDDLLYIGMGDGGDAGDPHRNGQSLKTLLAKILRIDPSQDGGRPYRVPADNPFVGRSGARGEIYAYGLRNPWRFSFDRRTRAAVIGDVGQDELEEIDYVDFADLSGANFGWSAFEGESRFNTDQQADDAISPILGYGRDRGCSVTGGYVVRDPSLPSLRGRYVYGDYCEGELRSFVPSRERAQGDRPLGVTVASLSSFGEDNAGRIYATSLDGPVYRLVAE
jgi:glucose/arabinose dehydrogenase